jgi:metal-responsive CopG/Arc/MetJ family transcriptional regulator
MARVLISLPDDFLATVDAFAASQQRSRSELIREALRKYMEQNPAAETASRAAGKPASDAMSRIQELRRKMASEAALDPDAWLLQERERT